MSETGKVRAIVSAASKPALPRHIKLRHDTARDALDHPGAGADLHARCRSPWRC